jgi:HD-GYP domain-containing protein (c-di-GMP phosphodiesterase class II)
VHDIGKIRHTHEKILNKPGVLDEAEWTEMKKHPEVGWRILTSDQRIFGTGEFVLCHHGIGTGKGYPRGLKRRGRSLWRPGSFTNVADSLML